MSMGIAVMMLVVAMLVVVMVVIAGVIVRRMIVPGMAVRASLRMRVAARIGAAFGIERRLDLDHARA